MFTSKNWQSKTAVLMALGFTSTALLPVVLSQSAIASEPVFIAQLFSQPARVVVESGTVIPVSYNEAEKIVVLPDETAPVTLTVAADVYSSRGTVVIPQDSQIEGELRPTENGTQFVASEVVFANSDRRFPIDATSGIITDTETITEESDPDILQGAAIGAAAAAVLSEVFGDIDFIEVLAGAGLGALAAVVLGGNKKEVDVIVVYPDSDLDLTLQSDFALE